VNKPAFYASLRRRNSGVFGTSLTQAQVEGCEVILAASGGLPLEYVAYLLATAYHETAHTMQPVRETLAASDAQAIIRLDNAFAKGKLPWVKTPYWRRDKDGKSWLGRGYVQLTHKTNYAKASEKLGVDLVGNPDLAMTPKIAALVLVRGCVEGWFTGNKLGDYIPGSYVGARRVVNGVDKADQIAGYAWSFEEALKAAGYVASKPAPTPVAASPAPDPVVKPAASGFLAWLVSLFTRR